VKVGTAILFNSAGVAGPDDDDAFQDLLKR